MGLGDLVLETLKKAFDYIMEFVDDFVDVIKRGILAVIEKFESDVAEDWDRIFPEEMRELPLYKNWENYVKEKAGKKPAVSGIILSSLIGGSVGTGIGMAFGGFGRDISNFFNSVRPVTPLPPDILAYGKHSGKITEEMFEKDLLSQGYAKEKHTIIYDYYKPKLTVTELLTAEKRFEKLDYDITQALKAHGYNDKEISILRGLSWAYPSPTDFIRFAVRDVFTKNEEIQRALSAEFPDDIVPYAEKAGMAKDVLMWYWKAHWELPSPTQIYEMLHRLNPDVLKVRGKAYESMDLEIDKLTTTKETVEDYLRQADYDIRWRQRLLAISYNPLTRVDLRRIYQLGLIDDEELLARLMEIGYTKEDARLLVEFYKTYRQEEAKEYTKSEIKNLLYYGLINDAEAKVLLTRLGYSEEDAKTLIELWKAKITEKDMRETQKFIRDAYALGIITRAEAESELRGCGLSEDVIRVVLDKEEKRRLKSQRLPSPTTIVKWLKLGIITKDVAYRLLQRINVAPEFIEYYIKEAEAGGSE